MKGKGWSLRLPGQATEAKAAGRSTPVARERNPTAPRVPQRRHAPQCPNADTPKRRPADTPPRRADPWFY